MKTYVKRNLPSWEHAGNRFFVRFLSLNLGQRVYSWTRSKQRHLPFQPHSRNRKKIGLVIQHPRDSGQPVRGNRKVEHCSKSVNILILALWIISDLRATGTKKEPTQLLDLLFQNDSPSRIQIRWRETRWGTISCNQSLRGLDAPLSVVNL